MTGLGKVVIHLLGTVCIRPFLRPHGNRFDVDGHPVRRILYVSLAYRGDLILCLPAIAALRKRFADCRITCWVREYNLSLARICTDIDEVISYETFPASGLRLLADVLRFRRHRVFVDSIRARKFDLLVDDSGSGFSTVVGALTRIPLRVGRNTQGFGFFHHVEVPYGQNEHLVEKKLRLLRALGIESADREKLRIAVDNKVAQEVCWRIGLSEEERFFTIQPFAGWAAKNWHEGRFASVVNGFARETDLTPVLVGGSDDREKIDELRRRIEGRSVSVAGLLDLGETLALISRASMHLGVDSVCSHMAAAAKVKSVTLFGPTNPRLISPLSKDNIVIQRKIECSPEDDKLYCRLDAGRLCPYFECMETLDADRVLAALIQHWKGLSQGEIIRV